MPPILHGFDFRAQVWRELCVSDIRPTSWNEEPFERTFPGDGNAPGLRSAVDFLLPPDPEVKEATLNKKTIILFHGSPGTGKTTAAEVIAEYAKRPLYQIQIGGSYTSMRKVEKEIETAASLDSSWQCLLLIKNVDILLDRISKTNRDLDKLEYNLKQLVDRFQGIVILTTNKEIGENMRIESIADFKLRFENLSDCQKESIWRNCLATIIGKAQIREEVWGDLPRLSRYDFNGHDIRKIVVNAKQFAAQRKCHVNLEVIDRAAKFTVGRFYEWEKERVMKMEMEMEMK